MKDTLQTVAGIETSIAKTSSSSRGVGPHAIPLKLEASGTWPLVPPSSSRLKAVVSGRPSASRGSEMRWLTIGGVVFVAFVLAVYPAPAASLAPTLTSSTVSLGRHADPELEALLPTTLGGVALTIESQAGTDLATKSAAYDAFLSSLGKTRADFSLASAYSRGGLKAEVGAWRVKGADPGLLLSGFKTAVQASSTTPLTKVEDVIAGRKVIRIGDPGQLTRGPLYVFVRADALLFVQTTERVLAEEAMDKLPK
jgi:hypothetical protein